MRINDAILGAVLLVFSLVVGLYARTFPAIPGQEYGASVFPTWISIAFGLCSIVLIAGGMRQWAETGAVSAGTLGTIRASFAGAGDHDSADGVLHPGFDAVGVYPDGVHSARHPVRAYLALSRCWSPILAAGDYHGGALRLLQPAAGPASVGRADALGLVTPWMRSCLRPRWCSSRMCWSPSSLRPCSACSSAPFPA